MWVTFKYKVIGNDQIITKKVNLDNVECINFFDNKIDIVTPMRFESDGGIYTIRKELNENFEEIKAKLMEL
ncbi:hypothetical protein M2102_003300 [Fusobacterium sp. PH5-7]|uniref:hypothetical protein n=1 Tax=Fusobacterium sp. PH5-7 TaxID=2940528 RepID=UPI0024732613|nr:hypothetical protein [Fusobacterium sp. PH5-7]MDH6459638.1 hypothetical protein [Fusobacterium sp. PH5-7]